MEFSRDIWQMTWDQCLEAHQEHGWPLITIEGHLIASRDRKLHMKNGRDMYLATLATAHRVGREIPEAVRLSEPELFGRLTGNPVVADELAAFDAPEAEVQAEPEMDLKTYMEAIVANINNPEVLAELGHVPEDKDCGYRAGLRRLGLERTSETDAIANQVIYGPNAANIQTVQEAKEDQEETVAVQEEVAQDVQEDQDGEEDLFAGHLNWMMG